MEISEATLDDDSDEIVDVVMKSIPMTDRTMLRSALTPETASFLRVLLAREQTGVLAGVGVARAASTLPAGVLMTKVRVRPELRRRRVAAGLFAALVGDLPDDVTRVATSVFAGDEASMAVALHWGFEPLQVSVTSSCDLSGASVPDPVQGVVLEACDDLEFEDEGAVESMLLASQTNPEFELGLVLSLTSFRQTPARGQRAVGVLARVDGQPAAFSFGVADGDQMHVIYTGVDPARRGSALGRRTKQFLHAHARDQGVRTVLTDNAEQNPGIRRVNEQLGYTRHSATHWMMQPPR